jgi:hypothetical protein
MLTKLESGVCLMIDAFKVIAGNLTYYALIRSSPYFKIFVQRSKQPWSHLN